MKVYQTAHALAERLGSRPAQFPGGHGGVRQPSRRVREQARRGAGGWRGL